MGNISWTKSWSSSDNGTVLTGTHVQNIQGDITTVVNGGITNTNINASAAIAFTKMSLSDNITFTGDIALTNAATTDNILAITGASLTTGAGISINVADTKRALVVIQGNVIIGDTAAGASADECLALSNSATAPSASADLVHLYGKDFGGAASSCALAIYQEDAVEADADETKFSNKMPVTINGTAYYIMLTTT